MSDTTETPAEPETETVTETPAPETPDLAAEVAKWKALSRKNEQQAKENAEKARKFDEVEEANKTELEKIQARADAAEKKLAELAAKEQAEELRKAVAKEKGFEDRKIPVSALRGKTREELEAHADELLAIAPDPAPAPSADGQGETGKPIGGPAQLTQSDLDRMAAAGDDEGITKAKAEGRLNDVLGIKST